MPEPDEATLRRLIANVTKEQCEYVRLAALKRRPWISKQMRRLIDTERRARANP